MHTNAVGHTSRDWLPVVLPFTVGFLGSSVDASLPAEFSSWGPLLGSLYYVPIVVAAIMFGARSALVVALGAGVAHILAGRLGRGDVQVESIVQSILFVCVAVIAARLAQRRADAVGAVYHQGARQDSIATKSDDMPNGDQMSAMSRVVMGLVRQLITPVTSIQGAGWVLGDPNLPDDKRRELVGIVRKESHRLSRVLSDVMDFMQHRRPRFAIISLSALVDDVIHLAGSKDQGRSYSFSTKLVGDLPALRGDPEQIRQALLNIVMNSVQASPSGGVIDISARTLDDQVVITITDQGQGIAPGAIDKIFDPFFSTHEHHLGLGLPLALRVVTEHGGRIAVDRNESEGTSVSIALPVGNL
jgi:two-component system, NtrC family, sensor histidine kinase HydH